MMQGAAEKTGGLQSPLDSLVEGVVLVTLRSKKEPHRRHTGERGLHVCILTAFSSPHVAGPTLPGLCAAQASGLLDTAWK